MVDNDNQKTKEALNSLRLKNLRADPMVGVQHFIFFNHHIWTEKKLQNKIYVRFFDPYNIDKHFIPRLSHNILEQFNFHNFIYSNYH